MENKHLLLVDGSNLLFQMFYGMPARITDSQGKPIQGTLGFVGALLKVIRFLQPTHIAVVFDGECVNPRKVLDEDYKANREDYSQLPPEETPFCQLPDIYKALDYLGICHRETRCCEADDWIAAYCCSTDFRVTVLSQDSDFFQLISSNVSILRYRGDNSQLCDRDYIRQKLGIEPCQYADFKSMVGDTADNIRGAEKIGQKTAAQLLSRFGSLEGILANCQQVEKPSIRRSLEENADRLRKNYMLIRLDGMETVPFTPEEMAYTYGGETSRQVLSAIGIQ